ncbi:MAG TPA: acetate--CoA ligase [Candidatus Saccharimonadales bacterium]|nr:acetate--CoA ligase [Candidatus Saccharimonadales bacterium]
MALTTSSAVSANIQSVSREKRVFPPPKSFSNQARISSLAQYRKLYNESIRQPAKFWARQAKEELSWFKPWKHVLQWKLPDAKWFAGGQLNVSYNCLDRHLGTATANKAALIWEGEPAGPGTPGHERTYTYRQLHHEVCLFANVLKRNGLKKGDRAIIYLPMVPEAAIAMLACARIGAVHSVVFGGFSAQSVADRIFDSQAKVVITADGGYRRGSVVPLKKSVDEALEIKDAAGNLLARSIEKVIVLRRTGHEIQIQEGRDVWWHRELQYVDAVCPAEKLESEAPLFILYTSGSTGKPKGILHTTAGYLLFATMTTKYVFDLRPEDVYWCTADVGWVTGHSYVVYGPLANGATSLMYEGAPNHPEPDRFWRIVARHGVTILYTAPTAIRAFMKWGDQWPDKHDLSSLRLLGTVGEPINPEAWMWYREHIGHNRCPIVDTWWQTETGMIMIAPLPGATPLKPGSATRPFPGVIADVVTREGDPVPPGGGGYLVLKQPWPAMLRTIYGDPKRYQDQYWSQLPGMYFTGDGARKDADGYFWIMGRIDDVINVSGHRLSTMEVESALVAHPKVAEAAVVARLDDLKGQAIAAFVTLKAGNAPSNELKEELRLWVAKEIGSLAKPDDVRFSDALPKTRSGKIMRRLLKEIASGGEVKGDTTTLEDLSVIAKLSAQDD